MVKTSGSSTGTRESRACNSDAAGSAEDAVRFREAMGRFATGITVLSAKTSRGETHCMTANGFMSISLQPRLVMVSIGVRAKMHDLIVRSRQYGVSVLAADQEALSRHFSGRPDASLDIRFEEEVGVPLVEGALAHVCAQVVDQHSAGDHTLFVGEVVHFNQRSGQPLIFHSGAYRRLLNGDRDGESTAWSGFCLDPFDPVPIGG